MNRNLASILILMLVFCGGCKKKEAAPVPDYQLLLAADPYSNVMQQEVDQYMSLYPDAKLKVRGVSTREAIVLLLNDSVNSVVADRQFNDEEKQIINQASIKVVENKIAEDGIAVIVNNQNPIKEIHSESIRRIITGEVKDWSSIPEAHWSGSIDLVLTGKNSGMYELLQKKFFSIEGELHPSNIMLNQEEVLSYVATHPQCVGFAAASIANISRESVKIVSVFAKSADGIEKSYVPQQQEIYEGLYPLHYSLYLYNAEAKRSIGIGFSAQVLSNIGQKIIQRAGLVPASIPYRTIQLNAE